MNIKKIGLTALAGSLVATSVFAADMSVTGSASVTFENHTGTAQDNTKAFSMGNQLDFAASGELDNGLTVSLAMTLDQNDDKAADDQSTVGSYNSGAPFDSHSVTVSSDDLGTFVFAGEGGSSASSALDTTAAGDMWDNFQAAADEPDASATGDNIMKYTTPDLMDSGLSVSASYTPGGTTGRAASSTAYGLTYTGVDGLTVSYGVGEDNTSLASEAEQTVVSIKYAIGSVTVSASDSEYDDEVATGDRSVESYNISYTVSDAISVSYGEEEITDGAASTVNAEFTGITVAYTAGGMTLTAKMQEGENISYGTGATEDKDYASVGLSFAF